MRRIALTGFFFLVMNVCPGTCQKVVQLERAGTLKTRKFFIGDEITFKLKHDDKGWYDRIITDIDVENRRIISGLYVLPVDSIAAISIPRRAVFAQIIGGALQIGGINTILFAAYWAIFEEGGLDWTAMGIGVANFAVGSLLRNMFRRKLFKPGKRKRIRLLDLTFYQTIRT